jgi:MYXO-CTERM domain-containing protein
MRKTGIVLAATLAAAALARPAAAFCGFYVSGADTKLYNNATQVVLMREGTRTVLSMQNNYQGPAEKFAMVVPVPVVLQKDNVKTLDPKVFDKLDSLDSPRLVEYWELDPCMVEPPMEMAAPGMAVRATARGGGGAPADDLGVKIEAKFTVGEYEVVILSAQDSTGLDTWLRREKYAIPEGAEPYLKPYVQSGSKFFVAKVDPQKVKFENGMAALSPLRFHYDSTEFSLPVRLGLINAKDAQDLIVHVLARGQRYEASNYANVTIPTNLDVGEITKGQFATFYAKLFDTTLEKNPKAVVTEYAWDAGTCDPCPGPALDASDLATLGADVLPSAGGGAPTAPAVRRPPPFWGGGGFVLTRLHARYKKDTLGADLVFKAAPPIVGGREWRSGPNNDLEHGAQPSGFNNFQGRYAIRHPWKGPITCANPIRGRWGGPPGSSPNPWARNVAPPQPAKNLAFAPRGGTATLSAFLVSAVPELGLGAGSAVVSGVGPDGGVVPAEPAIGPLPSGAPSGEPAPSPAPATSGAPAKGGCAGCATVPTAGGAAEGAGLAALAAVLGARLRRRKKGL